MVINNKYKIGQVVYLKTDTDQKERIVTGIDVRIGHLLYQVCLMENTSYHYDYELSSERDTLRTL